MKHGYKKIRLTLILLIVGIVLNGSVMASSAFAYLRTLDLRTEDPANWALCETTFSLSWNSTLTGTSRWLTTWAANPTPLNTHWYLSSSSLGPIYVGLGQVSSSGTASYYNYDFLTPLRTDVRHDLSIIGYPNGTSQYSYGWYRGGEGWYLLHLHVYYY
jgi:hypothetical protein